MDDGFPSAAAVPVHEDEFGENKRENICFT